MSGFPTRKREFDVNGVGDVAFLGTFDLLEMLHPSLIPSVCPITGGDYYASADKSKSIGQPHLSFNFGLVAPIGEEGRKDDTWIVPPQYQTGGGVWSPSAGVYYSQVVGPMTPGVGATYTFSGGENKVGYEAADALALSLGTLWNFAKRETAIDFRGDLYAALAANQPIDSSLQNGKPVKGSRTLTLSLDTGTSLSWNAHSTVGALVKIPLIDAEAESGVATGVSISLFIGYSL